MTWLTLEVCGRDRRSTTGDPARRRAVERPNGQAALARRGKNVAESTAFNAAVRVAEHGAPPSGWQRLYGVVHLHRGAIRADSAEGQGTTFFVRLPRGTQAVSTGVDAAPAPQSSGVILVVEDEDMLRGLASTMLRRLGCRTLTAADGVEGVELFRRHHQELSGVLLDL